ncbi:uncharacterized protein LOC131022943 [Salvia miltiorrhiza]|uniref:uncharacterized protein LOC131022943 n=1 Tax=Salvia miltiorrhiza TaxID=226208 RepID=UPI0025ABDCEB|nr:uncharacterized protein LOC131022943 [Salvia miltiorrhiza]
MPEEVIPEPAVEQELEEVVVEEPRKRKDDKRKIDSSISVPMPFPQKVHINIPLVEELQEMPQYAKLFRDIISRKKRLGEFEIVNLNEECSAILPRKLPGKLKDSGSFTISCIIGGQHFGKALCDLGASINLMPLSIFQRLANEEMKPTSIPLHMADRTIPLILGRPFLATGRALIDVANEELTLRVNDESHTFSIYRALKFYDEKEATDMVECKLLSIVESYDTSFTWKGLGDPLEACISRSIFSTNFDFSLDLHPYSHELFECCSALDSKVEFPKRKGRFLELRTEEEKKKMKEEKGAASKLELNLLPDHLRYAFLGNGETYPVIVSAYISPSELDSLLHVLRKHKSSIG